jgi:hypothetical protein
MRIVSDYVHAIEALATASVDSLDYAMLYSSYKNTTNLAGTLYSSKNLTNWFAILATKNEDLTLQWDDAIANHNTLTTRVTQLQAQLMQTLTLATTATNLSPTSYERQTNPKRFTGEDHGKLRSFVALLHLWLINRPREFPNE